MNGRTGDRRVIRSVDDIRAYFARTETPYLFVSATDFNLMGLHARVRRWLNITLIDCYDGAHPQVLNIADDQAQVFTGIEQINHYLLSSAPVRERIEALRREAGGVRPRAMFLFFDEQTERDCASLGLDIPLPPSRQVREIDSKIVTTEIGNAAGVASVPNVLARVDSWKALQAIAREHGLGERLVVQTAWGDSGKTTFFIDNEEDYAQVSKKIEKEDRVKVMRRIRCTGTAIEACATKAGTCVGPLLTELIGAPSLTPFAGGWCGNELYGEAFTPAVRRVVMEKTRAMGDALYARGYRGYFELDFLLDSDTQEVWLGELNARITGISAMTNLSDFCTSRVPLFLFHLLEWDPEIDLQVDVDAFNEDVLAHGADGVAAQLILKYTDERLRIITQAPRTGVYRLDTGGTLQFLRASHDRRDALGGDEAFLLRIAPAGDWAYRGGDLAILFLNQVVRDAAGRLNENGERWTAALRALFEFRELTAAERAAVEATQAPSLSKGGPVE